MVHDSIKKSYCIIGAGVSGLAIARKIVARGGSVTVLEKKHQVGGAMTTVREDGYLTENGPNTIQVGSAEVDDFVTCTPGLKAQLIEPNEDGKRRFLVRKGKVRAVPTGPLAAITSSVLPLSAKLRMLREPFIKPYAGDADESVADFARRRIGEGAYKYAINALVGGIYAGDPETLSVKQGFPKLHALEKQFGSLVKGARAKQRMQRKAAGLGVRKRMITYRDGLGTLPREIAASLGDRVKTGITLERIEPIEGEWRVSWKLASGELCTDLFDRIVFATPAQAVLQMPLPEAVKADLSPLSEIEYPPLSVLHLGFQKDEVKRLIDGFGMLIPECEKMSLLGVLYPSSVLPDRAPEGEVLLSCFIGGTRQPKLANPDLDTLMQTALPDLRKLLGIRAKPVYGRAAHWRHSIPQYTVGYGKIQSAIDAIERKHHGLYFAGNYRTGVSVPYCIESAGRYLAKTRAPFADASD